MPGEASSDEQTSSKHQIHRDELPTHRASSEGYEGILSARWQDLTDVESGRHFAEMIVDTVREALLVLDFELRVKAANESFFRKFGVGPEATLDHLIYELQGGHWDNSELRTLLEEILPEKKAFTGYEIEVSLPRTGDRVFLLNGRRLDDHQLILLALDDVTELWRWTRELEEHVQERTRKIRELAAALTLAEQQERRRISAILHDDLQQILYAMKMNMKAASDYAEVVDTDEVRKQLVREQELLEKCIAVTRNLSIDLRPPILKGHDFTDMLIWLASRMKEQYGLEVEVSSEQSFGAVEEDMQELLYRVVRELLFNVTKHAGTDAANVEVIGSDDHLQITVVDEGRGFDKEAAESRATARDTLGLFSLRERLQLFGGDLLINTEPGAGTRVTVKVPLAA